MMGKPVAALLSVLCWIVALNAGLDAALGDEQVFFAFDDQNLAWQHNLRVTLLPAEKHPANPVLRTGPEGSPDFGHAILYGTVVKEGDRFRMWYLAMFQRELERGQAPGWWRPMCYAESADGIHWTKPELGLVEFNGSTRNNICRIDAETPSMALVNDFLSVMIDERDPDPARRYKVAYIAHMPDADIKGGMSNVGVSEGRVGALVCATSADGLSWKVVGDRPANATGERFEVSSLYRHGDFYYAGGQLASPWCWLPDGRPAGRVMMTYRSPDFVHWSRAKALSMVLPQQFDLPQHSVDEMLGGRGKQMHMGVGVWDRGNVLIGVPGIWQGTPTEKPSNGTLDGLKIDLGLAISNDGVHFRQPIPDFKLIEHGGDSEWDSVALLQGHAFVNEGDHTLIWYSHWDAEGQFRSQEIGLATLRRDGFGYLSRHDPGDGGHCITSIVEPKGTAGQLFVNVTATDSAPITIELLDHLDRPLPGYSGDAAARVTIDNVRAPVSWPTHDTLPADRPFAIRINLPDDDSARLYAAYVETPQ